MNGVALGSAAPLLTMVTLIGVDELSNSCTAAASACCELRMLQEAHFGNLEEYNMEAECGKKSEQLSGRTKHYIKNKTSQQLQ